MNIFEFDFFGLSEIIEYVDILSVERIDKSTIAQQKTVLYFHRQREQPKCCGLVVLGLHHSKYDLSFIKQRLNIAFDRACLKVIKWEGDEGRLYFEIEEKPTITVDGATTLISLESAFADRLDTAKDLKKVSHYTTVKAAEEILSKQVIKAKSLSRYKSEAVFSINENSRRLTFFSSFSRNTSASEEMWNRFGDKHCGCKLDFCFSHSFWHAFSPAQTLRALDKNEKEYEITPKRGWTNSRCIPGVWIETHFYFAEYSSSIKNNSVLEVQETEPYDFTVIDNIGKWVFKEYDYQDEARIVMLLCSSERVEVPFITEVFLPFNPNEVERVVITIGNRATKIQREKIFAVAKECDWIVVFEEP